MNDRGSAIISALFIMILVSIAATAMSLRLQIDIKRTTLIKNTTTLLMSAQNATLRAMSTLIKYQIDNKHPLKFKTSNSTEGVVKLNTQTTDLQGLFNLNNLVDRKFIRTFAELLIIVNPKLNVGNALEISEATAEWIRPLNLHKGQSRFDSYYQKYGYEQPHMPIASVSEFRLIKGVNQAIYQRMQPFLSALPSKTSINVNRAPLKVMRILGAGLTKQAAETLIDERGKDGFTSVSLFNQSETAKKMQLKIDNKFMSLQSNYYLIAVKASLGTDSLTLFTRVQMLQRKDQLIAQVLMQSINTR